MNTKLIFEKFSFQKEKEKPNDLVLIFQRSARILSGNQKFHLNN